MGEDELTLQKATEDFITDRELNNYSVKLSGRMSNGYATSHRGFNLLMK